MFLESSPTLDLTSMLMVGRALTWLNRDSLHGPRGSAAPGFCSRLILMKRDTGKGNIIISEGGRWKMGGLELRVVGLSLSCCQNKKEHSKVMAPRCVPSACTYYRARLRGQGDRNSYWLWVTMCGKRRLLGATDSVLKTLFCLCVFTSFGYLAEFRELEGQLFPYMATVSSFKKHLLR